MRLIRFWVGRTVQYRTAVPAPLRLPTTKPTFHRTAPRRLSRTSGAAMVRCHAMRRSVPKAADCAMPSPPRCGYLKPESKERRAATCRNGTATCRDVPVRGTEPALTVEQFTCQKAGPHNSAVSDGYGMTSVRGWANFSHLAQVDHARPAYGRAGIAGGGYG